MSIPRNILSRASTENLTSLAGILLLREIASVICSIRSGGLLLSQRFLKDAHDVALFHDQVVDAVELDLRSRPFAKQHAVANLQVNRGQLAGFVAATRADGDDLALRGLLLGGVGDEDAAGRFRFGINTLDNDTIVQWAEFHWYAPKVSCSAEVFQLGLCNLDAIIPFVGWVILLTHSLPLEKRPGGDFERTSQI